MDTIGTRKLTGWLILLILQLGPLSFVGGVKSLRTVEETYKRYIVQYPSLSSAIMLFQLLVGAGIAAWAYTAWVLYQREPGTLGKLKIGLVLGFILRIAGVYTIPLFGGLPPSAAQTIIQNSLPFNFLSFVLISIWYLYLLRSQRVREIYAAR